MEPFAVGAVLVLSSANLSATNGGPWAKSFVPSGTQVPFRATNDCGATSVSVACPRG